MSLWTESQLTVTARDPKTPPVPSSHVDIGTDLASLALTPHPESRAASRQIEDAVAALAQEQQRMTRALEEEQARQRESLTKSFKAQQQALIAEIMSSVNSHQSPSPEKQREPHDQPPSSLGLRLPPPPFDVPRSLSPVVPAAAGSVRPISTLPPGYAFPAAALDPRMHARFCRLSAAARGWLTRRLLRTHKVEALKASMRDTMHTALQLHRYVNRLITS